MNVLGKMIEKKHTFCIYCTNNSLYLLFALFFSLLSLFYWKFVCFDKDFSITMSSQIFTTFLNLQLHDSFSFSLDKNAGKKKKLTETQIKTNKAKKKH